MLSCLRFRPVGETPRRASPLLGWLVPLLGPTLNRKHWATHFDTHSILHFFRRSLFRQMSPGSPRFPSRLFPTVSVTSSTPKSIGDRKRKLIKPRAIPILPYIPLVFPWFVNFSKEPTGTLLWEIRNALEDLVAGRRNERRSLTPSL